MPTATDNAHRWHALPVEAVARELAVEPAVGLSAAEAALRLARHGPNRLTRRAGPGAWRRWLRQFNQPLVYVLLIAVAVTLFLAEFVDAGVILGVVLVNAVVGYLQEAKAEQAIAALARLSVTEATVRRDGRRLRVPSEELVPGDLVLLQSGDRVPADLRLVRVSSLRVDESALTGESLPAEKHERELAADTGLADRRNLAFAGTLVTYGQAEGVVCVTGDATETGRIATLIAEAVELSTPLTRKIAHFSRLLLWAILALAAATFLLGTLRGEEPVQMFMAAVALAVGAIPEGLPAAVTITLAIGVARMARRRAIIRKLPAVETLGSTTVICSDKTGTLTENQMTVQEIFAGGERYGLTGSGYEPAGELLLDGRPAVAAPGGALHECLRAGLLCNDAQLVRTDGRRGVQGDPTEAALIVAAEKAGLVPPELQELHPRVDMIPFESEHMFRATLHDGVKERLIYQVGAMERLLERCADQLDERGDLEPLDAARIRHAAEDMAARGLRVLAMARRHTHSGHDRLAHADVAGGLTFLGLQGMIDPPRPEAIAAVAECQSAGIRVKMITGDHALTARAIARQIGLRGDERGELRVLTGRELERIDDARLAEEAQLTAVFARVAPEQKFRLVQALQARGEVVAMTGDGVNDAPALKQADIGIAMGITGTEVAKGAADMLLTDDNFASIEAAVEEGRGVFDNLTKFIVWTLPTNAGEALILLTAIILAADLPVLPVQLLWINLTTAVLLGLMLVFEPKEAGLMRRPPRDPQQPLLTLPLLMRTGLVTLLMLVGAYFLFHFEQQVEATSLAEARTIVVNTIVLVEVFYLLNCRSLIRSAWSGGFFGNRWLFAGIGGMLALQILFTHAPIMNRLFHSAPVSAEAWLHSALVGLAVFCVVEVEKWVRRRGERQASK